MINSKQTTVAFRCNEEESERLKEIAAVHGCTVSKFVHNLVINTINEDETGQPLDGLILSAGTQLKMARGIAQLCILAEKKLIDDDKDDYVELSRIRCREIIDSTQDDGESYIATTSPGDE